jgi:hypothetical protein
MRLQNATEGGMAHALTASAVGQGTGRVCSARLGQASRKAGPAGLAQESSQEPLSGRPARRPGRTGSLTMEAQDCQTCRRQL